MGVGKRSLFATGRANSTAPPGRPPQPQHNQRAHVGAGAETAGGWRGNFDILRGFWSIYSARGGRIEVVICDREGKLDRTAQSATSTTQQSTSEGGGGGWNGRGMTWRHCFYQGILVKFFGGGGGGRIEVIVCDRADKLDRTAWSPTSTTPKSTSARGGG